MSLVKNKMDHPEKSPLTKEPVLDGDLIALCLQNRSLCPSPAICFQGRVLTYVLEVLWCINSPNPEVKKKKELVFLRAALISQRPPE